MCCLFCETTGNAYSLFLHLSGSKVSHVLSWWNAINDVACWSQVYFTTHELGFQHSGRSCSEQKVNRVWTVTAIHECWRQTEISTKSARETLQRNAIVSRYAVTGSAPISMYIFYIRFWLFELSWFSISLHFDLDHQLCILSCCFFITMAVNSFCWSYW